MALSEWDKKNLTGSQQRAVLSYTEAWERATRAGDAAAAKKAHEGAESIRRLTGYSGNDSGTGAAGRTTQPDFANPNPVSRIKDTIAGGVKRSLASDLNSTANAYDLTRGARERMMNE